MIPLGPVVRRSGVGRRERGFGVLMTALGFGAAIGVVSLLVVQRRLPRETVFQFAVMATGVVPHRDGARSSSTASPCCSTGVVGACAGTSYVTGFTVLQENVTDELRGRTFAALYTVIRLCLLISLDDLAAVGRHLGLRSSRRLHRPSHRDRRRRRTSFPGVRFALWGGGLIAFFAGLRRRGRSVQRTRKRARKRVASGVAPEPGSEHMAGRFIVLEGGDASGKSTQAAAARRAAAARGRDVRRDVRARRDEVGRGHPRAAADSDGPARPDDRGAPPRRRPGPAGRRCRSGPRSRVGADVVSDRFVPSSLAYQGVGARPRRREGATI